MEACAMDTDKSITRINPAQEAFDKTQKAVAAHWARRTAESNVQNRTKPGDKPDSVPTQARFATSQ
jgi:hypothetical protein